MKIKYKEEILKAAREKQQITHKGIPIRITADLSIETLQTRREWQDILKVMKEKNLNQDNANQQGSHSAMKKKPKALQTNKKITHKGILIMITVNLSIETLQARREWQDIFKVMKEKNLQPRLLFPARISFKYEGEIKSFTDKQKLREFSTTKPAFQQMLKELL